jgi:hypothetical protein
MYLQTRNAVFGELPDSNLSGGRRCILPKQDTVFLNPTGGELLDACIEQIKEQRFYKNCLQYSVEGKPKDENGDTSHFPKFRLPSFLFFWLLARQHISFHFII